MKKKIIFFVIISILSQVKLIEIDEDHSMNTDDPLNFIYTIRAGPNEDDMEFLIDSTRQNTYIFRDKEKNATEEEYETNIEVNNLYMRKFEYKLSNNFLTKGKYDDVHGILGFGTIHGKNMFMDQMYKQKLIKKKKIYFCLNDEESKKLKFQYELPKRYGDDFLFCPLVSYKDSYGKKYRESWMCELTHFFIKNEEEPESINKTIYLNSTTESLGKVIFNPNTKFITIPETYLQDIRKQYSINSRNRCSVYKKDNMIYLYCKYQNETNFNLLPYFSFIMEGFLFKIPVQHLFVKNEDGNFMCLIRFSKNNNKGHLWEFGLPLFKSFVIQFDFDNKRVGLGEPLLKPENLTSEWIQWYSLHEGLSPRLFANKTIMIIGFSCFIAIILLIFICAIVGYFKNYFSQKNELYEENIEAIEMSQKKNNDENNIQE
jgi:hypothetical protein